MKTTDKPTAHFDESFAAAISDEYMQQMLAKTKTYCIVILKATPKRKEQGTDKIVWEHGRRNFALSESGILPIVCPVTDNSDISGLGIFNSDIEQTRKIMDMDPAVKAGLFTYEIHACRGFPGSTLPDK